MNGTSEIVRRFGAGPILRFLILAIALAGGAWGLLRQRAPAPAATPALARAEITIHGKACLMCAAGLQNQLRALDGVARAEVSFQDHRATVEFDPARISRQRLAEAIERGGFKADNPGDAPPADALPPSLRH